MTSLYVGLGILVAVVLIILGVTVWKTRDWKQGSEKPALKGLALPEGSVRALIAFLLIGAFVIFVFLGKDAVVVEQTEEKQSEDGTPVIVTTEDTGLFTTVLTAFGTLTGAVTGFYFADRRSGASGTPSSPPGG